MKKTNCTNRVAIIGAGASGSICAYFLLKFGINVVLFDKNPPLKTLLPTGGGRCNLAHAEFNPKDLALNYPRGEKFLYSIFSKFATADTIDLFTEMGIDTYAQEDGRIFPTSNSSSEVRNIILNNIKKLGGQFKEKEIKICADLFSEFDAVIIAVGGHSGYDLVKPYKINIIPPKPSLVGLNTKEKFSCVSGIVIKNVFAEGMNDDLLFTDFGLSGPLIYKISSIKAFDKMPYNLVFDLAPRLNDLQEKFDLNPHKDLKNVISDYIPKHVAEFLFKDIDLTQKAHTVNSSTRKLITERVKNFPVTITGTNKGAETVTAGGIDLNEINPKTLELKKVPNLYCIGEFLNIDGFCGGFNLQNAWSTAYVCAQGIIQKSLS